MKSMNKVIEKTAKMIFPICAITGVLAVVSITVYMFIKGTPALKNVGIAELLFGNVWKPTANPPAYGIAYIILSSIIGTFMAVLIGIPVGLLTAVFLSELAGKKIATIVGGAVELLAAVPFVIYGLIGMMREELVLEGGENQVLVPISQVE